MAEFQICSRAAAKMKMTETLRSMLCRKRVL